MDNHSTAADIGSLIGALELGDHLEIFDDGVLLTAADTSMLNPPTVSSSPIGPRC